jgi:DNA polymerase-3 subunit beta
MPDYSGASRIVCDDLPGIVAKTLPASAKDEIRYYLKGLCFDHTAHAVIGCDGHRMHIVKNAYATNLTGQAIVPRDVLDLIGAKNLIHMDFTATHCRIGYVGGYLICRLVDGKFPDYDRVLPADNSRPNVIPFNGEQISAVKSIVAVNKANSRNKYNGMAIAQDGSLSACDITIPCFDGFAMTPDATKFDKHSGEYYGPKIYGVNATYLFDAMSSAGTGTIAVNEFCDSMLIANGDFRAVVMPMRI